MNAYVHVYVHVFTSVMCICILYSLLDDKRKELGDQATKLTNGLDKLIETREKVQAMTIELEEAKIKVAEYQKQCEDYLVIIVQQKRDAEEQEKVIVYINYKMDGDGWMEGWMDGWKDGIKDGWN